MHTAPSDSKPPPASPSDAEETVEAIHGGNVDAVVGDPSPRELELHRQRIRADEPEARSRPPAGVGPPGEIQTRSVLGLRGGGPAAISVVA